MDIKLDENLGSVRVVTLEPADVTGELWIIQGTILQKYQPLAEENEE